MVFPTPKPGTSITIDGQQVSIGYRVSEDVGFLSSELDTLCSRCKRLFPVDMVRGSGTYAQESHSWGVTGHWNICPDCVEEIENNERSIHNKESKD